MKRGKRFYWMVGLLFAAALFWLPGSQSYAAGRTGVVYTTPDGWTTDTYGTRNSAVSPRVIQLQYQDNEEDNGKMLITWEWGVIENEEDGKVFPIYESTDQGETWTSVGSVVETENQTEEYADNRWGMECCPQLFELPADVGTMKKGGIVCIGCVCPKDLSLTHFDMYYSEDMGRTWTFMSSLVTDGGRNYMGDDPVWEPFILYDDVTGSLICYYSDERYDQWNQKLVYQATTDGVAWGDAVDVVAWTDSGMRPGMPVVTQLENGYYVMTYEAVGMTNSKGQIPCNYKISLYPNDPFHWDAEDVGITYGYGGSPYCTTLDDGRVVMSASSESGVFINTRKDLSGVWNVYDTGVPTGYNRQLMQLDDGTLYILSCGFPDQGGRNQIKWGKMDVEGLAVPDDAVRISNGYTGRYMCIWSTSTEDDARVIGWSDVGSLDLNWTVEDAGDGYVRIVNVNSGKALTAAGDDVVQRTYSDGDLSQLWTVTEAGDGLYTIVNAQDGRLLTSNERTTDSGSADDVALYMSEDIESETQLWNLALSNEEAVTYQIIDGTDENVDLYPSSGSVKEGAEQYFIVTPEVGSKVTAVYVNGESVAVSGSYFRVSDVSEDLTITVEYEVVDIASRTIMNKESGKYLCLPQNSTEEGKGILEWTLENAANFYWLPEKVEGTEDVYTLCNLNSGLYMSVYGSSDEENADVVQTSQNEKEASQWQIQPTDEEGYFKIINVKSGLALTRETTDESDHYMVQATYTGSDSQLWALGYVRDQSANPDGPAEPVYPSEGENPGEEPGEENPGEEPGENPGEENPGEEPGENPGEENPGEEPGENPGEENPGEEPGETPDGENPDGADDGNNQNVQTDDDKKADAGSSDDQIKAVQTGDTVSFFFPVAGMAAAMGAAVVVLRRREKM